VRIEDRMLWSLGPDAEVSSPVNIFVAQIWCGFDRTLVPGQDRMLHYPCSRRDVPLRMNQTLASWMTRHTRSRVWSCLVRVPRRIFKTGHVWS
jgi:hypothetical protein